MHPRSPAGQALGTTLSPGRTGPRVGDRRVPVPGRRQESSRRSSSLSHHGASLLCKWWRDDGASGGISVLLHGDWGCASAGEMGGTWPPGRGTGGACVGFGAMVIVTGVCAFRGGGGFVRLRRFLPRFYGKECKLRKQRFRFSALFHAHKTGLRGLKKKEFLTQEFLPPGVQTPLAKFQPEAVLASFKPPQKRGFGWQH